MTNTKQTQLHPLTLYYKSDYLLHETHFRLDFQTSRLEQQKLFILLSLLFYDIFILMDIFTVKEYAFLFLGVRLLFYTPVALLIYYLTHSRLFIFFGQYLLSFLALIGYLGILYIHINSSYIGVYTYRYALLFVMIYYLFFLSVRYLYATLTGVSMLILYNIANAMTNRVPTEIHFDANILFLYVVILGIIYTYMNERNARVQYLLTKELIQERNNVTWMNTHLENRVKSRTQELKETIKKLSVSEQAFQLLLDKAIDPMFLVNPTKSIIDCNHAFLELFSLSDKSEVLDQNIDVFLPEYDFLVEKSNTPTETVFKNEFKLERENHPPYYLDFQMTQVKLPEIDVVHVSLRDVTERVQFIEKLESLSYKDQLTDLFNRRYFTEMVLPSLSDSDLPMALLLADVNGLKLINDTFGHMVGDRYLIEAAQLLKKVFFDNTFVCRLGGDEFAIIVTRCSQQNIFQLVDVFRQESKKIKVAGVPVSLSFGFSYLTQLNQSFEEHYKIAEDYMYRNKVLEGQNIRRKNIDMMIQTLHEKSPHTKRHSTRTTRYAMRLGKSLGLTETKLKELELVGLLHDLGKIAIPDEILNKKEPLNAEEVQLVRQHPEIGYRILNTSEELSKLSEYVLHHHEHWDGTGYPSKQSGESIPLISRIIAIADAYEAMTSPQPYHPAMTEKEAIATLKASAGKNFDPDLIERFCEILETNH